MGLSKGQTNRGSFKKGSSGFTGKHSEETKRKISNANKGNIAWNKGIHSGIPKSAWKKGDHVGENHWNWKGGLSKCIECKQAIKRTSGYCKKHAHSGERANKSAFKKGMVSWNKGLNSKNDIRILRGENHPSWPGGITPINKALRQSLEYEEWRTRVFERDLYTCQNCGEVGGRLEADHIKPWSLYPELRFELFNGRTLCYECHKKIGWNLFRENNPKKKLEGRRLQF